MLLKTEGKMAKKRGQKPEPSPEDHLIQRTEELTRLRKFIDETAFSADQRELTGEITVADQHPADVADFTFERELLETTREIIDEESRLAREALQRTAAGQYGICAECGKPISPARLAARPQATLCIDCQRRLEAAHDRRAS